MAKLMSAARAVELSPSVDAGKHWRERVLNRTLQAFALFAPIPVALGVYLAFAHGLPAVAVLDVAVYAWLLAIYFFRSMGFLARTTHLLAMTLTVSLGLMVLVGTHSAAQVWVLVPVVLAAVLLDRKPALLVYGVAVGSLVLLSLLAYFNLLPNTNPTGSDPAFWLLITVNLAAAGLVLSLATNRVSQGLELSYREEQAARRKLADERSRLLALQARLAEETNSRLAVQDQLRQAQKMEAVGRLAGGVAHDLNNLLTPIMGNSEILRMDTVNGSETAELIDDVLSASTRAKQLVQQLLAFGRKQTMQLAARDVNEVLGSLYSLLRRTLRDGIRLDLELSPNLPRAFIDSTQIDQVVLNLCINAQYAIEGNGRILIRTESCTLAQPLRAVPGVIPQGDYVRLTVSDDGHGIQPEHLERLFEPFFTTREQGEGSGLGLSTVFGIVKQHGGGIDVCSEPGEGAEFSVYLPVTTRNSESDTESEENPAAVELSSGTILLIEDDRQVRKVVRRYLTRNGYSVIDVSSPADALDIANELDWSVDLLVSDVMMPEQDGWTTYQQLRDLWPELKVLFISGYSADILPSDALEQEHCQFQSKPFKYDELLGKVQALINGAGNR